MLSNGPLFQEFVNHLADRYRSANVSQVVGIESRGFILGAPLAHERGVGFSLIRKPGKLPPPVISQDYEYEYASGTLEIKGDTDIGHDSVVGIIDDVNATGGTALAIIQLLIRLGVDPKNIYYACVIDLKFLNGSNKIRETGVTMISLVEYDD